MSQNNALVVDVPLDAETVDSILTIRKMRMHSLRQLLKNPGSVAEELKKRNLFNTEGLDPTELIATLKDQLADLERYDAEGGVHLQEVEYYLSLFAQRNSSSSSR